MENRSNNDRRSRKIDGAAVEGLHPIGASRTRTRAHGRTHGHTRTRPFKGEMGTC